MEGVEGGGEVEGKTVTVSVIVKDSPSMECLDDIDRVGDWS